MITEPALVYMRQDVQSLRMKFGMKFRMNP
jgi:hypothetical protein